MGCDGGLLSAGGSVEPLMCVVQELCNLYHGGGCLDVKCRVKSGRVGISRVKAGDIFFWQLLSLRFCIGFSVSGVDSWFWQPLHDTHPRLSQTPDSSRSAGGWGAGCRVRTLQVGLSRAEAGSFPIYGLLRLPSLTFPGCLCWAMGRQIIRSLQSYKGPPSPSDSQPVGVIGS